MIINGIEITLCKECPGYVPGCCTVDNMPAEDDDWCKFTPNDIVKQARAGKEQ